MNKRFFVVIAIMVLALALFVTGCGGNDATSDGGNDGKQVVLKFGAVNNTTHPAVVALNEVFKPRVEELTNGQVEVQIFDNAQLGGERDMMEQMQMNTLQMSYISPVLGAIEPAINILDLPFLFSDENHVDMVIDGPIGEQILADLPSKGLRGLGYMENGFRVITNSRQPINSLADLEGLKIRTPEAPISVAIFQALKANVTPLSFNELYSALQQGVVDGQENAFNTVASSSFFEVQEHVAETNHMWGSYVILVSEDWWQAQPKEIQDAVEQAAKEASVYQREVFREMSANNKQLLLDNGMQLTEPDTAEFFQAVEPVYANFYNQYPEYQAIVEEILSLQ